MEIDWQKGPPLQTVKELKLKQPDVYQLDNGIKVLTIKGESKEITKVDIVFKGARWLEKKKVASRFVSALLREGTSTKSGLQIAETLDYHGANIKSSSNLDFNYVTFSCLNKHLDQILPLIAELVLDPLFSEDEIDKYRSKSANNLALDLARNELYCYREFTSSLYGKDHPYGYNTTVEALEQISRADIVDQYNRSFNSDNCFIIISGNPPLGLDKKLNTSLGSFSKSTAKTKWIDPRINFKGETYYFDTKSDLQSAIKIGKRLVTQSHEDYPGLYMLNTILGGYFGSRLMSSIREERGLTYNIYSAIDCMRYDGYFYIATEIDNANLEATREAINEEINLLRSELVSSTELSMVKNYLTGNFLSLIDGPFNYASIIKTLESEDRSVDDFIKFYKVIQSINAHEILDLAVKYLDVDEMTTTIVKSNEIEKS